MLDGIGENRTTAIVVYSSVVIVRRSRYFVGIYNDRIDSIDVVTGGGDECKTSQDFFFFIEIPFVFAHHFLIWIYLKI